MTTLDGIRELFSTYPFPGKNLVWVVDEIVQIVQHTGSVQFDYERDDSGEPRALVCWSPDTPGDRYQLPISRLGVFRSMLARVAVMGAQESGTEFKPYGGSYSLTRSSHGGPVRLDFDFTNTPAAQRLSITRTPVARPVNGHPAGTPAAPPAGV